VRPAGDALQVAIAQQHRKHQRRQAKREPVELRGGQHKNERREHGEAEDKLAREQAGRNGAAPGAGIDGVQVGVGPAVEGHGRGAGGNHGDENPGDGAQGGQAASGEQRGRERKRQREDGVLPLDHLQRGARFGPQACHCRSKQQCT
jgi:hypothetical protein